MLSLKKAYEPVKISTEDIRRGFIRIENRLDFTSTDELFRVEYGFMSDGVKTGAALSADISVEPKHTGEFKINIPDGLKAPSAVYVNIVYKKKTAFADEGDIAAWEHFDIDGAYVSNHKPDRDTVRVTDSGRYVTCFCGDRTAVFDMAHGTICKMSDSGRELLASEVSLTAWRAPTDNDRIVIETWNKYFVRNAALRAYRTSYEVSESSVTFNVHGILGAPSRYPLYNLDIEYVFDANGIKVSLRGTTPECTPAGHIPRVAFRFNLVGGYENVEYYGYGPYACYSDFRNHVYNGHFSSDIASQFEHMIKPQECGNHIECRHLSVTGKNADKVSFDGERFEFSALPYSIEQIEQAKHDYALKADGNTYVLIDYKVGGVGSHSCGPKLPEKYALNDKEIDLSFKIRF